MIQQYYERPFQFSRFKHWLTVLNIVLAIGLAMASFSPGTPESDIVYRLRHDGGRDLDEGFYFHSKELLDQPDQPAFEVIQVLLLQSVYLLVKCMRSSAYAHIGTYAATARPMSNFSLPLT